MIENDVIKFIDDYSSEKINAISFQWNGKHASEFFDANQEFRTELTESVIKNPENVSVDLVRDLFIESSKWSVEAWCSPFYFSKLGEIILSKGGKQYLNDFLTGFIASFDTFGACHQMSLNKLTLNTLLLEIKERLQQKTDEGKKKQLEAGLDLFTKLASGTAHEGWATITENTPITNIRVVHKPELVWRKFIIRLREIIHWK
jgi:hypothetical protein